MKRAALLAALLLASFAARAQTSAPTKLPPARDGVITPDRGTPDGLSRVDPHMPVVHPTLPGRTPVIRPRLRTPGGGTVIDPR